MNALLVGFCERLKDGELLEHASRHLTQHHAAGESVLYVVGSEALLYDAQRTEAQPVVGHLHHAALCLVGVEVLSPQAVVEGYAVDVVLG